GRAHRRAGSMARAKASTGAELFPTASVDRARRAGVRAHDQRASSRRGSSRTGNQSREFFAVDSPAKRHL
ncbi:MAG: hypothetical protein AVDCRST_MAG90-442, partial [uncultured Microvirga sp.]